jgi:hypothetical protein
MSINASHIGRLGLILILVVVLIGYHGAQGVIMA